MGIKNLVDISNYIDFEQELGCNEDNANLFFPEGNDIHAKTMEAKKLCAACPMTVQCFNFAVDNDEKFGIWGGATTKERAYLKRFHREKFRFFANLKRGVFIHVVKITDENSVL